MLDARKAIRPVLLAVVATLAGIGALSLAVNYRDFAFILASHMMNYKWHIRALEGELAHRGKSHAEQIHLAGSLRRANDSLGWKIGSLERTIESHKLSFKKEVDIRLHGYADEITVLRTWERGVSLVKRGKRFADLVVYDFVDIGKDTALPDAYRQFKRPESPWYIDPLLSRLHREARIMDGGSWNCMEEPLRMKTWINPFQIMITKVEKTARCEGESGGTKHHEYWLGTAKDTGQWIMSLKAETGTMSRLGLKGNYIEKMLDSLALESYYLD